MSRSRVDAILSKFVTVHRHETSAPPLASSSVYALTSLCFLGAISLGLFIGSLFLTSVAAPLATLFFS